MTSAEIRKLADEVIGTKGRRLEDVAALEIAYQLAVMNERHSGVQLQTPGKIKIERKLGDRIWASCSIHGDFIVQLPESYPRGENLAVACHRCLEAEK